MADAKRFLEPNAIKRISRLDLRARHIVEGFLSGMHRSPYFGQSVEFLQHREYAIGDDLRHVDWQVWARQDRLYIKQYEEDTNMRVTLLVDVSKSMQYGEGDLTKYEYACTIASCLAYLILKQQDAVGCVTFDDKVRTVLPIKSKRNHLQSIIHSLNVDEPESKTDISDILNYVAETYPRRGMIVIASDFFAEPEGVIKGMRMLRQRGHDVLAFHILDDDEIDFPFSGPTRFEGLETDDHLNCNPRALREEYLRLMQEFIKTMRRSCAKNSVDYATVRTSDSLDVVLANYLSTRMQAKRR